MAQWLHRADVAEMPKTARGKHVWQNMIADAAKHGTQC